MKKLFPIVLVVLSLGLLGAGGYTLGRGFDAKAQVRDELAAQKIVTPEDASIPNAQVKDAATAKSMADIIGVHADKITDGKTYAELGRFLAVDGGDTSDEAEAMKDAAGNPVPNPVRNTAFQASALRTSLYTSVMAFDVANLVIGIGALILVFGFVVGGLGVVLAGLSIPAFARRFRVEPVAATA